MKRDPVSNIHVYIERLILDGLPVERIQAPGIQRAVEAELTRLLADNGVSADLTAGSRVPSVRAHPMPAVSGSHPAQIGTEIARSIFSGIGERK